MKKRYLFGISTLFIILSLVFLSLEGWKGTKESCFYYMFGEPTKKVGFCPISGWEASVGLIIAFIFLLVCFVSSSLCLLGIMQKGLPIVTAVCGIMAAILLFCAVPLSCAANSKEVFEDNISLGIGFILSGIFILLGGIAAGASLSLKK